MQTVHGKLERIEQLGGEEGGVEECEVPKQKSHSQSHHSRVLPEWKYQ
jgi:hypothetical protein